MLRVDVSYFATRITNERGAAGDMPTFPKHYAAARSLDLSPVRAKPSGEPPSTKLRHARRRTNVRGL